MKVSVHMITYNHEKYIGQAIESVLMQRVSFPMELVIGEDCSKDGTRAIVCRYRDAHPEIIHALLPETNLGAHENSERVQAACTGEYIAILEGDDYWTDPDKLQKQVDFLDAHPACSACGHIIRNYDETRGCFSGYKPNRPAPETFGLSHFIRTNAIQTLSLVFRRTVLKNLPEIYHTVPFNDYLLKILCAQAGQIGFLNSVMGVYRMHGDGMVLSNKTRFLEKTLENLRMIAEYLPGHATLLRTESAKVRGELLATLLFTKGVHAFRLQAAGHWQSCESLTDRLRLVSVFISTLAKSILLKYLPGVFLFLKNRRECVHAQAPAGHVHASHLYNKRRF